MSTSQEHDDVVVTLVQRALTLPAEEQQQYLRTACGADARLFEETSERVRREVRMGRFLLEPIGPFVELESRFAPGQVLAERFEVVREVGEGGMAWVYEAHDRTLDQRIAIKCAKPIFSGRLLPETVSALKVAHDNVCRVHEIHRATTDAGEVEFLTMEFLDGETLRDRLDREKRLSLDESRTIARQLCGGLEGAHRKGIIHGDLKPNNIMLTETVDHQLRAVITDFGLARPASGRESPLTGSSLFGAPAYVAPELSQGASRSVASDLYALGVILYEALNGDGTRAIDSGSVEFESGVSARPPVKFPSRRQSRRNRAILRCLHPDPGKRPETADALLRDLEGKWSPARRWLAAVAALLLCVVVGLGIGYLLVPPPALDTIHLAVLPFEAEAGSEALVSGVAQEVADRLGRVQRSGRGLTVSPPGEATKNNVDTARMARAALGATHTLQAAFRQVDGRLLADADVRDSRTEQIVRSFSAEYAPAQIGLLPKALLATVTAGLRLDGVTIPETVQPAAYADYVQGLYYLNDDEHLVYRAIPFFERAAKVDLNSALPYAGMAESQALMFGSSKDRRWLARAEESLKGAIRRNSDALEVHLAAGLVKRLGGQPERALDDFRRAVQLEPGNPDALRRLAEDYGQLGLHNLALETYQQAISARPGDYHPYMNLGVFQYYRAQYPAALAQFGTVTRLAPGLAQGHLNLGGALAKLGRYEEGEAEIREALRLREDRDTWTALGAVLAYERRHQESAEAYEHAVLWGPETHLVLSNLADAYRRCSRSSAAREKYRRALEIVDHELTEGDPGSGSGPVRAFAGYLSAHLGDSARAEREIKQALRLSRDAEVLRRAALTFEALGNREETLKLLETVPRTVIDDLSRQPDSADLAVDPRFIELISKSG